MTTPADLERQHTLATAVARYDELRMRDLLAPGADDPPAEEQPGPLSRPETLELLALSEVIARKAAYGRQLTVRSARAAGASWTQIGAALGTTKQSAWEAHSRWIDQQLSRRSAYGHLSMDSQQAAAPAHWQVTQTARRRCRPWRPATRPLPAHGRDRAPAATPITQIGA